MWLHEEMWQKLRLPERNRRNTSGASSSQQIKLLRAKLPKT